KPSLSALPFPRHKKRPQKAALIFLSDRLLTVGFLRFLHRFFCWFVHRFCCRLLCLFLYWCLSRFLFLIKFFRHRLLGCFRLAVLLLAVSFLTASAGAFGIFVLCLILSVTDYLCTNGGCSCCHRTQNCQ